MTIAGLIAAILIGVLIVFQLGLAAGAPWGAAAWGGRNPGVLPVRLRMASGLVGLLLYPWIALVILACSGWIDGGWLPVDTTVALWILAGFFAIGAVVNGISRSPPERVWSPVSAAIAICCVVIALG